MLLGKNIYALLKRESLGTTSRSQRQSSAQMVSWDGAYGPRLSYPKVGYPATNSLCVWWLTDLLSLPELTQQKLLLQMI
jgi:hypothetical protein